MAYKVDAGGLEELQEYLEKVSAKTPGAMKRAVYSGAKLETNSIRNLMMEKLSKKATGELARSLYISEIVYDGFSAAALIGFTGYDAETGVPNQLKAAVLESGVSGQNRKKTHFFSQGFYRAKGQALDSMGKEFISSITKDTGE